MAQKENTNFLNESFTDDIKDAVWKKCITTLMPNNYKLKVDIAGRVMDYEKFGDRNADQGWEIDHIKPKSKGGSDELYNLQPLNWKSNVMKADTYPWEFL